MNLENSSLFLNCILWNGKMRVENISTKNALSEEKSHIDQHLPERTYFFFGLMNLSNPDAVQLLLFLLKRLENSAGSWKQT